MASKKSLRLLSTPHTPLHHTPHTRLFSHSAPVHFPTPETEEDQHPLARWQRPVPRWQQTPTAMAAPFRLNPMPTQGIRPVNDDPRVLDDMYRRLLGPHGPDLLSEETKWLAVTHKSFDHGRRGFNDRLTFLGKRILDLQASLALLEMPSGGLRGPGAMEGRKPFEHAALESLGNLTEKARARVIDTARLATLGRNYGLDMVIRWRPRMAKDLRLSGEDAVISGSFCAIIGALALERGGEVANKVTRDVILKPLRLKT